MAGRVISVYRRTAFVIDSVVATSVMTLDRSLESDSILSIKGTPSVDSTVLVTGSLNGNPKTETVEFPSSASETTRRTVGLFDEVSQIEVSAGMVGSTINVRSVGEDGSTLYQNFMIISGIRAHLNHGVSYWRNLEAGTSELQDVWFGIDYSTDWAPREGDIFVDVNEQSQWYVTGTPEYLGHVRPSHWEVRAKRREGSLPT